MDTGNSTNSSSSPLELTTGCPDFKVWNVYHINLIPATVIIIILCFLRKRTFKYLDHCGGRPGIQVPVNFIDESEKRWAYAFAIGSMTENILDLFGGEYLWLPKRFEDPVFAADFGWLKLFVLIVNVLEVCVLFYPFVACISARHSIIANILGMAYALEWCSLQVINLLLCPWDKPKEINTAIFFVIYDIPVIVCNFMVVLSNLIDLVNNLLRRGKKTCCCEKKKKEESTCVKYVRNIFRKKPATQPPSILARIKECCTYRKVHGFRYSPRVICTMFAAFLVLWKIVLLVMLVVEILFAMLWDIIDTLDTGMKVYELLGISFHYSYIVEAVYISYVEVYVCVLLALLYHIFTMVHMVLSYRSHLQKVLKGDRSWMYRGMEGSPANAVVYCLRYSGYQIAYICWSFLVMTVVLFLALFIFTYVIILPLKDGYSNWVLKKIVTLWPTVVLGFVLFYLQVLLAKFVFLIDRGPYLALNNRSIFHVVTYFLFVFNVLLGLFSCLRRILLSLFFGLLTLGRLDRSSLMRDWESFDAGYKAYMGMLELEASHNHPIVKAFIEVLQKQTQDTNRKSSTVQPIYLEEIGISKSDVSENGVTKVRCLPKKWPKNKWLMAVTLSRNLDLTVDRIKQRQREELDTYEIKQKQWDNGSQVEVNFEYSMQTHL